MLPRARPADPDHLPAVIHDVAAWGALARRERAYRRGLAVADLIAALASILVATTAMGHAPRWEVFLLVPAIVFGAKLMGLYDRDDLVVRKTTLDDAPRLFQLSLMAVLVVWLADSILLVEPLHKPQAVVLGAALPALTLLARRTARSVARRVSGPERCVFVGDAASYHRLSSKLADPDVNVTLVGRMGLLHRTHSTGETRLRDLIATTRAERVIIEPQSLPATEMLDLVRGAKALGVPVSLLPRVLDVVGSEVVFDDLRGMMLLGVRRFGMSRSSRAVKRAFDLAGAGMATLVLAPLMASVALLIKLDSRGPVIFRQTRVGRDARRFEIMKFRTMVADAEARKSDLLDLNEAIGLFKIADDPRVTRVGRFLRRTSLDELPQLFNVLRGDMSLVGPRPLVVDEDEQIRGYDRRRLRLTPGMTGHWQIAGSARVPLAEMLKIDYLYVASWSLWVDVKILLRTVPYVLSRRGL